jgi:hypothetical protein
MTAWGIAPGIEVVVAKPALKARFNVAAGLQYKRGVNDEA